VRKPDDETVLSTRSKVVALERECSVHFAELLDRAQYLPAIADVLESDRIPDIFIHCAGLQHRAPAVDFPEEQWDKILEVNLTAGFLIAQALARHWLDVLPEGCSFADGSKPKVVFISSVLSGGPGSSHIPAYVATKGSIHQLTKALSNEWAPRGICVNSLAPGYIETKLTAGIRVDKVAEDKLLDRVPMRRWGGDGDLEGAVIWLCSRASDFVSGTTVIVDGGFSAR
jgi:2-dehydro-3-deoxy-D-gluconate 5-dehydrogenase